MPTARPGPSVRASLASAIVTAALILSSGTAAGSSLAPVVGAAVTTRAAAALPALPAAWPSASLEAGLSDSPGGAAALHSSGAYKFRYQYLCGGVNTGSGWSTWNANAKFADYYVDESVAAGITPVFIYYQLLQSSPAGGAENQADLNNLKNTATMKSYWADVRLMFQHLGAYSKTIVVDIEPDLWGYIEQASSGDNGAGVPAAVTSSGAADVAGLADDAAGFAKAFAKLRDKYAPNVLLGYELSMWGTLTDPLSQNVPLSAIPGLAARSATFEQSLGASFDLVFTDPADRDAGFDQYINGDGGRSWWDATDYDRFNAYVGDFVRGVGLRMVLWQIPLGNTKMRAVNNTWGHYQDNHTEWWFDDATGSHLAATADAGVVAMLFGGGAGGTTSAFDTIGDGITNPAAINGNTQASYNADDDGGYFRHQVNAYYAAGALALPGSGVASPAAGTYVPVDPKRLLDTRIGTGLSGTFVSHSPRTFVVAGGDPIPADATAVTGNLTVTGQSSGGFVTLGPTVTSNPNFSTINFPAGDNRANGVTVALGPGGTLQAVFVGASGAASTQLLFDVTGYFAPDLDHAAYHAVSPYRALDTRVGTGIAGAFVAGTPRIFSAGDGVPATAEAVTGNLTVTGQTSRGFVTLGPAVSSNPSFSTLNFPVGDDRANNVTVKLGAGATLQAVYVAAAGARTHLVFDVTGYYVTGAGGASYVAISPVRLVDTRLGKGLSGALHHGSMQTMSLTAAVPSGTVAVSGTATITGQSSRGYVAVGPNLTWPAHTSTVNFPVGDNRANGVVVPVSDGLQLEVVFSGNSSAATTHFVFDLTGFFLPKS